MSKFSVGQRVRITNLDLYCFDEVGVVTGYDKNWDEPASWVLLTGEDEPRSFKQSSLTLADPDVHTVLDQMDAESAPRKSVGMDEREIDGEYVPGLVAAEFGTPCLTAEQWEAAIEPDPVNHPQHYGGDTTYEVIKVAEAWGLDKDAYLFNVLKYVARAGKKGDVLEDLEKGDFYLNRRIATIKAAQ